MKFTSTMMLPRLQKADIFAIRLTRIHQISSAALTNISVTILPLALLVQTSLLEMLVALFINTRHKEKDLEIEGGSGVQINL